MRFYSRPTNLTDVGWVFPHMHISTILCDMQGEGMKCGGEADTHRTGQKYYAGGWKNSISSTPKGSQMK